MSDEPFLKRIALAGYHNHNFLDFAKRLGEEGMEVFWINSRPLSSRFLLAQGIPKDRVCEVLWVEPAFSKEADAIELLSEFEHPDLPSIHSIVLMDRVLRHAPYQDALLYLAQSVYIVKNFLTRQKINFVSSGRDTALQLLVMLICKKLGIFWGCVTRAKLPTERFSLSPTHQGDNFYMIRDPQKADYDLAEAWLKNFRTVRSLKPAAKPKISGFGHYIKQVRKNLAVLKMHFLNSFENKSDKKIPGASFCLHIGNLMKDFRNYVFYRFLLDFDQPINEPFVLYGLHRQPESSIDVRGAFFDEQFTLIKQLARSLPVTHKLYVKVHFSDVAGQSPSFYRAVKKIPGVKLIHPDIDSRYLIQSAAVIITNSGAMGQEGGLWGRPVITMSRTLWSNLPTVRYCDAPPQLPGLICSMIKSPPVDDETKVIQALAELFSNSFACDPNRSYLGKELSVKDLDILSYAYSEFFKFIENGKKCAMKRNYIDN